MVSVIIPTYGGGDGIDRTINSVLNQTYKEIEVLIVDDNGKNTRNQLNTKKIIDRYDGNPKVRYIVLEKNMGGSAARNAGARVSKGNFLMFLDDDDTISSDKIEKQVQALCGHDQKYDLAYSSTNVFSDGKLSNTIKAKKSGDILYAYLMGKVYMGTGTVLIKRKVWEELKGYDESFVRHQDWEFFSRALNDYQAIAVSNAYFNRYITNRNIPQNLDSFELYMDHFIEFLKNYNFRISKRKLKKIINNYNSQIAIRCIRVKKWKKFFYVMEKYDNPFSAYLSFAKFSMRVVIDKFMGKRS